MGSILQEIFWIKIKGRIKLILKGYWKVKIGLDFELSGIYLTHW
jgi:hypothetical protein